MENVRSILLKDSLTKKYRVTLGSEEINIIHFHDAVSSKDLVELKWMWPALSLQKQPALELFFDNRGRVKKIVKWLMNRAQRNRNSISLGYVNGSVLVDLLKNARSKREFVSTILAYEYAYRKNMHQTFEQLNSCFEKFKVDKRFGEILSSAHMLIRRMLSADSIENSCRSEFDIELRLSEVEKESERLVLISYPTEPLELLLIKRENLYYYIPYRSTVLQAWFTKHYVMVEPSLEDLFINTLIKIGNPYDAGIIFPHMMKMIQDAKINLGIDLENINLPRKGLKSCDRVVRDVIREYVKTLSNICQNNMLLVNMRLEALKMWEKLADFIRRFSRKYYHRFLEAALMNAITLKHEAVKFIARRLRKRSFDMLKSEFILSYLAGRSE